MKVALCVSGVPAGREIEQIESLKRVFPYDCFVHTWDWCEFPDDYPEKVKKSKMIDLPEPDERGLYSFTPDELVEKGWDKWFFKYNSFSAYKKWRFFNHWENIQRVDKSYDVIIKANFECFVDDEFDWNKCILDCYENGTIYAFKTPYKYRIVPNDDSDFDGNYYITKKPQYIFDEIIIHPNGFFRDPYKLLIQGKLKNSEKGWYELLKGRTKIVNIVTKSLDLLRFMKSTSTKKL